MHKAGWCSGNALLSRLFFFSAYSSTLKREAICSSETSVDFQRTTRRYIPEDSALQDLYSLKFGPDLNFVCLEYKSIRCAVLLGPNS
jgi:hypothetical protein